jgi:hypothetical protein
MENTIIKTDKNKVNRLIKKIILLEKTNLKTREHGSAQIVKKIQQMIEEEVDGYQK